MLHRQCSSKSTKLNKNACEEFASVETSSESGNISTEHFGDAFDADKVETNLDYTFKIHPPSTADGNSTLHIHFEKISLTGLTIRWDHFQHEIDEEMQDILKQRHGYFNQNYTPPGDRKLIRVNRQVLQDVVSKQTLQQMPGIRVHGDILAGRWCQKLNTLMMC